MTGENLQEKPRGTSRAEFLRIGSRVVLAMAMIAVNTGCFDKEINAGERLTEPVPTKVALAPLQTVTEIAPGVESVESIAKVAGLEILTEAEAIAEMDAVFGDSRVSETLIGFKNGEFLDAVKDSEFFKTENINTEVIGIKVKDAERKQDNVFLFIESTSPDEEGKGFMSYVVRDPATGLMGAASLERVEGLDGKAAMAILSDPLTKEKLSEPFIIFQTLVTLEELDALSELPEEEREKILDGLEMYFMVGLDVMSEANQIEGDLGFKDYLTTYREPFPELTEEMQEMGLQVKQEEDGRTIAVDERGYMRFYEKDGEWVDYYQELIYRTTMSFWDSKGEWQMPSGVDAKRMWISPIFTGEVEEFTMVMDDMNVKILSLVAVITDPVDSSIIREVRVPIQFSLPDGEISNGPMMYTEGNDFRDYAEDVLRNLEAGDQLSVDMYTRVFTRHPVCTLDHECGPPIVINETQGYTDLFTKIWDFSDSSSWPDRFIVPALVIRFYP